MTKFRSDCLAIQNNTILDDRLAGGRISGIHFAPDGIHNVEISENRIRNHNGAAIRIHYYNLDMSAVNIHNNQFHNNDGGTVFYQGGYVPTVYDNCTDGAGICVPVYPTGSFLDTPDTCVMSNGYCDLTINWRSENTVSPKVTLGLSDELFSDEAAGSQTANWLWESGNYLDLYSGKTLLSTRWIITLPE